MTSIPPGPLMIDIAGTELTDLDRDRLCHQQVGGIILFARNYVSIEQLERLCAEIHALRAPRLLIAVDHEGGRVQRFREGFTRLPPMRRLGELWDERRDEALAAARAVGLVLGLELRRCGVDFSFTPVLDLDYGASSVIGDRAFHRDAIAVAALAGALIDGLHEAGMAACGKHFPGHGHVAADSHVALPVDGRRLEEMAGDLEPYRRLRLDAVMPAHVIYPEVDGRPAGFSPVWLTRLRDEFAFDGVIFSDDLSMEGASVAGDIVARADAAWNAGCDMLLVCNSPEAVGKLLAGWRPGTDPAVAAERSARVLRLLPMGDAAPDQTALYQDSQRLIAGLI
ncbi:beta-hexosaminidase [mine drainage metagenome]|uniref:beta-N-acetylhexosaminidase n=1 Tax=mine drainage metagenome TaxID=410659 RepID=A0A1J5RL19_9ZZZZ